jgi:tetratricopeptide (TPR) repeat protein
MSGPHDGEDSDRLDLSDLEHTKIDLGDDLLEKTAFVPGMGVGTEPTVDPRSIEPSVQNARILLNEGFTEEAKKLLRQILIQNQSDVEAQKILEEIHHSELKQIFGTSETGARKSYTQPAYDDSILRVDTDEILRSLDEEFELDVNAETSQGIFSNLSLSVAGSGPRDRIDLAISFLEMELYTHATQLLKAVILEGESAAQSEIAVSLLAYGHLMNNRPFETISVLQPFINDVEVCPENRMEFYYLMGRAHQTLGRKSEALGWYLHVQQIEPTYRDTFERIKQLHTKK